MRWERPSGHAGPLAGWERIAILALLVIMVGLIVLLTISAAPAHDDHAGEHPLPGAVRRNAEIRRPGLAR
jgi:hypothetical protein